MVEDASSAGCVRAAFGARREEKPEAQITMDTKEGEKRILLQTVR